LKTEHFGLDLEQRNEQERNQELFIGHFGFYSFLRFRTQQGRLFIGLNLVIGTLINNCNV
jgi:hypothetical protein